MAGNRVTLEFAGDSKGLDKAVKDVDSSTKKMGGAFDKLATIGAAAGLAAGAAIAAGIGAGLEQSKTVALLDAQLGQAAQGAGHWGAVAGEVYARGVAGSLEEAGAALKGVLSNNLIDPGATDKQLGDLTAKVTNVAAVLGEDAGKVSAAVSQLLRTGLAKNAGEAFDIIAAGAQKGINKAEDLLDTFNEYGTQFRKLGIDGKQALGLLSQGLQAGARDADLVADALKEFSIRAIDGSKTTADGFKRLGLDAKQLASTIGKGGDGAAAGLDTVLDRLRAIKDPVQQAQIAVELFGTQSEDLGKALYALDLTTAADGLGNIAGAADKAGKALESSAGARLDAFKRKVQGALIDKLGEAVPYVEKTFGWLQKNSDWVMPLAAGIGALAGAIGVYVLATKAWAAIQVVATAVQWASNAAFFASPITWIVLGVVALAAGIYLLATKTQFFQTVWSGTWDLLKAVGSWFAGPFAGFFVTVWDGIVAGALWVKDMFVGAFNGIKSYVSGVWDYLMSLPGKLGAAFAAVTSFLSAPFRAAFNLVATFWNNTIGRLHWGVPDWVPGIGGSSISAPTLPHYHQGGIVPGGLGAESLAVLQAGERVSPAGGGGGMGDMRVVELRARGDGFDTAILDSIRRAVGLRGGDPVRVITTSRG